MTGSAETAALRESKRILDDVNVWMLLIVSVAITAPWVLRLLPADLSMSARAGFGVTFLYVALALVTDRLRGPRSLRLTMLFLQVLGIVFLGLLWHLAGGLQVPMLLLGFVLPVVASGIVLGKWQPYGAALFASAVVGVLALKESRELRWFLPEVGRAVDRSLAILPDRARLAPTLASPPDQLLVLLLIFAIVLLGCALLSQRLGVTLRQRSRRLGATAGARRGVPGLFQAALKAAASPAALVCPESGRIVLTSDGFIKHTLHHGEDLSGVDLFDLVRFVRPHRVRELLQTGGGLMFCRYHVGSESRIANLCVDAFCYEDTRYACVRFDDSIDLFYLSTAVQNAVEPLLVIGSDDRLRYANRAARDLFGELWFGMEASAALARSESAERWWTIDARSRGRRLRIRNATYLATAAGAITSDLHEALSVVTLRPVAPETAVR